MVLIFGVVMLLNLQTMLGGSCERCFLRNWIVEVVGEGS